MRFKDNFFANYLVDAPLALALERTLECQLYINKKIEKPVLDLGCGDGIFANTLFDTKIDAGIDPNSKEIKRAAVSQAYKNLLVCYGNNIPYPNKSFKTIISNSVMEHIVDIESVLKEAHRLLNDDGKMYLTLPSDKFDQYTVIARLLHNMGLKKLSQKHKAFFNTFWRHYHYYSFKEWQSLFQSCGFELENGVEYADKYFCVINSLLSFCAFLPFLTKKAANRWFLFKGLRKCTAKILHFFFQRLAQLKVSEEDAGGLIFFELRKIERQA